jgi:hypothetical protein
MTPFFSRNSGSLASSRVGGDVGSFCIDSRSDTSIIRNFSRDSAATARPVASRTPRASREMRVMMVSGT